LDQDEKDLIAKEVGVCVATVDKYVNILTTPGNKKLVNLINTNGRPRRYPVEVDMMFIEWAMDPNVPLNEKTMADLILKYVKLLLKIFARK